MKRPTLDEQGPKETKADDLGRLRAAEAQLRKLCAGNHWTDNTGVRMVEVEDVLAALDGGSEAVCRAAPRSDCANNLLN